MLPPDRKNDSLDELCSAPKHSSGKRLFLADFIQNIRPMLKSVARTHAKSVPDCKEDESDIVQRSTLKAIEHVDQFQGNTSRQWRAWLISIVRNQAKDVRRYWSQERRALSHEENDSHIIRGLVDKSSNLPNQSVDEGESNARLDEAIACLEIEQQMLVRWRLFQFATYSEIAKRLQTTETTARRRCEAAMTELRTAFTKLGSESSA